MMTFRVFRARRQEFFGVSIGDPAAIRGTAPYGAVSFFTAISRIFAADILSADNNLQKRRRRVII